MEQRKSDIDTGDSNVVNVNSNGLNYSFDFSNQVSSNPEPINPTPMPAPASNVEPAPMPGTVSAPEPQPVVEPVVSPEPAPVDPVPTVEPVVSPKPAPVDPVPTVEPVVSPEPAPVDPVPTVEPVVSPEPAPVESVNNPGINSDSGMQNVAENQATEKPSEQANTANVQGEELIEDKKGTKKFLIIITIIVVAFIIALPFIFNLIG